MKTIADIQWFCLSDHILDGMIYDKSFEAKDFRKMSSLDFKHLKCKRPKHSYTVLNQRLDECEMSLN